MYLLKYDILLSDRFFQPVDTVRQHPRGTRAHGQVQVLFVVDTHEPHLHAAAAQVCEQTRRDHGIRRGACKHKRDELLEPQGHMGGSRLFLDLLQ